MLFRKTAKLKEELTKNFDSGQFFFRRVRFISKSSIVVFVTLIVTCRHLHQNIAISLLGFGAPLNFGGLGGQHEEDNISNRSSYDKNREQSCPRIRYNTTFSLYGTFLNPNKSPKHKPKLAEC